MGMKDQREKSATTLPVREAVRLFSMAAGRSLKPTVMTRAISDARSHAI
jgi:hypothetical protein